MGKLLIIGCGGVAGVAIHKCCQNSKTFSEICIASRTKEKCDALKEKLEKTTDTVIIDYRMRRSRRSCHPQVLSEQQNFFGNLHCEPYKGKMRCAQGEA